MSASDLTVQCQALLSKKVVGKGFLLSFFILFPFLTKSHEIILSSPGTGDTFPFPFPISHPHTLFQSLDNFPHQDDPCPQSLELESGRTGGILDVQDTYLYCINKFC